MLFSFDAEYVRSVAREERTTNVRDLPRSDTNSTGSTITMIDIINIISSICSISISSISSISNRRRTEVRGPRQTATETGGQTDKHSCDSRVY